MQRENIPLPDIIVIHFIGPPRHTKPFPEKAFTDIPKPDFHNTPVIPDIYFIKEKIQQGKMVTGRVSHGSAI